MITYSLFETVHSFEEQVVLSIRASFSLISFPPFHKRFKRK